MHVMEEIGELWSGKIEAIDCRRSAAKIVHAHVAEAGSGIGRTIETDAALPIGLVFCVED